MHTLVAFAIIPVKRPVSGEVYAHQLVLATINEAKYNPAGQCYEQSFAPKYRIAETMPMSITFFTQEYVDRWRQRQFDWHKCRTR